MVLLLPAEMAKLARRKPAPVYAERVYDTVSRALPTPLERVLYAKVRRSGISGCSCTTKDIHCCFGSYLAHVWRAVLLCTVCLAIYCTLSPAARCWLSNHTVCCCAH